MKPTENHIQYETKGNVLGYRDLVNMYEPVWKSQFAMKLTASSRDGEPARTDTIEIILHREKPKYRRSTYVRAVCDIIPQKTETRMTRLTARVNRIDYPVEFSTPTPYLTTMKWHVNSAIYYIKTIYICIDVKYFYLNNRMDIAE